MAYYYKGSTLLSNSEIYSYTERYATKPKGKEPAPYKKLVSIRRETTGSSSFIRPIYNAGINTVQSLCQVSNPMLVTLLNKAYDSLKSDVYESMQAASNIVEGRQTLKLLKGTAKSGFSKAGFAVKTAVTTIIDRAHTLRLAYLQLKRGNFVRFLKILRVAPLKKHKLMIKSESNQAANLWLAYWFGWKPLVQDIYFAMNSLTGTIGEGVHTGRARTQYAGTYFNNYYWVSSVEVLLKVKVQARFILVNPNAFLREQAGLTNPASWLWEAIPFSFLVDWFANVSQCLSAMTDFTGLLISEPHYTKVAKVESTDVIVSPGDPTNARFTSVNIERLLGLPGPVLRLTLPKGLSVTRGATAIALLLQVFNR